MFRHIEGNWGILRHIQALLSHIKLYSDIFWTMWIPCKHKHVLFRTLAYLEPETYSKACQTYKMIRHIHQTCKMIRHIQCPGIANHFQGYLGIFRNTDAYIFPDSNIILFAKSAILNVWYYSEYACALIIAQ